MRAEVGYSAKEFVPGPVRYGEFTGITGWSGSEEAGRLNATGWFSEVRPSM